MEPLRCLIADIPQVMLGDILQRFAEESEHIEVVDRIADVGELPGILNSRPIDVVILGMEKFKFPPVCSDMLKQFSNLLFVGLVDDGRMAAIYLNNISGHEVTGLINILGRRQ